MTRVMARSVVAAALLGLAPPSASAQYRFSAHTGALLTDIEHGPEESDANSPALLGVSMALSVHEPLADPLTVRMSLGYTQVGSVYRTRAHLLTLAPGLRLRPISGIKRPYLTLDGQVALRAWERTRGPDPTFPAVLFGGSVGVGVEVHPRVHIELVGTRFARRNGAPGAQTGDLRFGVEF